MKVNNLEDVKTKDSQESQTEERHRRTYETTKCGTMNETQCFCKTWTTRWRKRRLFVVWKEGDVPYISTPQNALEEMIVKIRQLGQLARPKVSSKPYLSHENSLIVRLAKQQQAKKNTKKPNVSATIHRDQSLSSTDEDDLPRIADVGTSFHLPTQYNSQPSANFIGMISATTRKELQHFRVNRMKTY